MDKDRLINIIKSEKNETDERERQLNRKAGSLGQIGTPLGMIIIALLRCRVNIDFYSDVLFIMTLTLFVTAIFQYKTGYSKKINLILATFYGLASIILLYRVLVEYGII